ncbi:MAG: aminopeptidase P family protein [Clostridiaceae bacterium]|nr:aminopeptidase P family protein [Clostridiaceae bacterium]
MSRFKKEMNRTQPEWEIVAIFSKINMYYFTGTIQEGMLLIPREEDAILWVRRSYDRAMDESLFPQIKPMESYRDAVGTTKLPETCHIEAEIIPIAFLQRFQKYFPFKNIKSADKQINKTRSVKSSYELSLMEISGTKHRYVLEECVPRILRKGMSEIDLVTELYSVMVREGHHGVARFAMFETDIGVGQIGFGDSSIYPVFFNGPGGNRVISPAVPIMGRRERKLAKGDLVFIDIGFGVDGYHTDKTMTYMYGRPLPESAITKHKKCVEIQNKIAGMLKPGNIPAEIYKTIMQGLDPEIADNFMGYKNRKVKFLGHGIGLHIDEYPVIAEGYNEPLELGMAIAVEPKIGIEGIGMVGIENTFLVSEKGGRSITGDNPGLIGVY